MFFETHSRIYLLFITLSILATFCPFPGAVDNGGFNVFPTNQTMYLADTVIEYFCDAGYKLDGGDSNRTCLENAKWSGQHPRCKRMLFFRCFRLVICK